MLQSQPVLLSIFQLDDLKQEMTSDVIIEGPCQGQHPSSPLPLLPLPPLNPSLYHATAPSSPHACPRTRAQSQLANTQTSLTRITDSICLGADFCDS